MERNGVDWRIGRDGAAERKSAIFGRNRFDCDRRFVCSTQSNQRHALTSTIKVPTFQFQVEFDDLCLIFDRRVECVDAEIFAVNVVDL